MTRCSYQISRKSADVYHGNASTESGSEQNHTHTHTHTHVT